MQESSDKPTYDELVNLALDIGKVILEPPMAGSQVAVTPDKVNAARVLMFHFGRGFRTFQAIGLLLANGYSQDGTVLARVLLEVLFEMAFIAKNPQDAELYLKYGEEMEKQWQDEAQHYDPWSPAPVLGNTKPKPKSSWHPKFKSVRQRGIAGGIHPVYYDMFYSLASRYIHGSGDWLHELTRSASADVHVSYSRDLLERKAAMFIACGCMVEMLQIIEGCLKIPIREQVASVAQEYQRLAQMRLDEVLKGRGLYVESDEHDEE